MREQERIFVGGTQGAGKTYAWLTIARACPKNKFYVIDPDDGVRRAWRNEFPDVNNIEYYFTNTWFSKSVKDMLVEPIKDEPNCFRAGVSDAWKTIAPKIKMGDWVIVEMMSNLWELASSGFINEAFEKGTSEWFIEVRKKIGESKKPLMDGLRDWPVINKMHNDDFINQICYNSLAHVFMTTSVTAPSELEDKETKDFYADNMVRFGGQKGNVYRAQTMLLFQAMGKGVERKYYMSTVVKDRARKWIDKVEVFDFYSQYLCDVAGWE